jgi:hypothetical protein
VGEGWRKATSSVVSFSSGLRSSRLEMTAKVVEERRLSTTCSKNRRCALSTTYTHKAAVILWGGEAHFAQLIGDFGTNFLDTKHFDLEHVAGLLLEALLVCTDQRHLAAPRPHSLELLAVTERGDLGRSHLRLTL